MPYCEKDPMKNIPTLSSYEFSYIGKHTKSSQFNYRGHIPIELKIKDIEFDVATPIQNKMRLALQSSNSGGSAYVNAKLTMPLKLTIDAINLRYERTGVDNLYKELKNNVKEFIKPVSNMRPHNHMFKTPRGFGFDVKYWITLNVYTGDFCKWERMEVDTAINLDSYAPLRSRCAIVKQFRLVLQQINGKNLAPNMSAKKLECIACGMWECECEDCYYESER